MQGLWIAAAASTAVAGWAALAERLRARREGMRRIGWVPWPTIMLFALMLAAVCAGLALKA